jgi:Flp pilus assembly pilin Flp
MERIKRFLKDESGSSEAASSVILIAGVGAFMAALVIAYYTAVGGFFTKAATWVGTFSMGAGS